MDKLGNISKSEMVLLSAYTNWPDSDFTSEELVVACWKKYPDSFGLQGYSNKYPDSNIVYRHIMGKSSIVKKQHWLSQKSQKRYSLTPAGINHALILIGNTEPISSIQHRRIDRFYEQLIYRILTGTAWNKYNNNQIDELTFIDACGFWSINPRSSSEQLRSAQNDMAKAILLLSEQLEKDNRNIVIASKMNISSEDLTRIKNMEKELYTRFKDQLDLISQRNIKWGKIA